MKSKIGNSSNKARRNICERSKNKNQKARHFTHIQRCCHLCLQHEETEQINERLRKKKMEQAERRKGWRVVPKDSREVYREQVRRRRHRLRSKNLHRHTHTDANELPD